MADVYDKMDESSDDSDNEVNQEVINQFKKQIEANEYDYEAHASLIIVLRKSGELEELRKAHLAMNKVYPLSPELWLAWLSDEQKICCSKEERDFVIELFKKAVQEYISVQVWVEYIMFMLGGGVMEDTRKVCEEALTAVGIHLAEGILVWQAVILVEQQYLVSLPPDSKESEEQKKIIQNLYRRQARVPLMNCDKEEFLSEASKWFDDASLPQVKRDLENSYKKMTEKLPFEEDLIKAGDETEKLEAYRKYIDFVRKNDNPAVIQNIYERAVTDICLNAGIWEEYVRFTLEQFPSAHYVILPVCLRSQLNCPWSSALFDLRISAVQNFADVLGQEEVQMTIAMALHKALENGSTNEHEALNSWMSYLVYRRRCACPYDESKQNELDKFRSTCDQAFSYMVERFGDQGDPECRIPRFRSRFEAETVKDMETARAVWNDVILKTNNNFKSAKLWVEFIDLERHFGNEKHCRKLYRRALERVWDDVELIGASFLQFEQQLGTLETMNDFEKRYKDRLSIVHKRRIEEKMKEESRKESFQKFQKKDKHKQAPIKSTVAPKFEKSEPTHQALPKTENSKGIKRAAPPDRELSPPPGYKKMRTEHSQPQSSEQKPQGHGEFVAHDSSLDYRTVFLSNMDYNVTEKDVMGVFEGCGPIESFRIAKDYRGRSKGFAYLIFEDTNGFNAALLKDRTPIGMRPLFVSKCNPKNRENVFKFKTGLEREKLFIKGLPLGMSEAQVKAEFEPHGDIKSIRLITNRNGYSKGTCYIEYHDAVTAESVRSKMDGAMVKDHPITVLISNPSEAAKNKKEPQSFQQPRPTQRRESQKPKLSFMPRSLQRKANLSVNPPKASSSNGDSNDQKSAPKSNEDFRKLFN